MLRGGAPHSGSDQQIPQVGWFAVGYEWYMWNRFFAFLGRLENGKVSLKYSGNLGEAGVEGQHKRNAVAM